LCLGLLSALQWKTVIANRMCLKKNADQKMMAIGKDDSYIFPLLSFIAIILALVSVQGSAFIYLLAPVYIIAVQWMEARAIHTGTKAT
jgi:hypothetical protein